MRSMSWCFCLPAINVCIGKFRNEPLSRRSHEEGSVRSFTIFLAPILDLQFQQKVEAVPIVLSVKAVSTQPLPVCREYGVLLCGIGAGVDQKWKHGTSFAFQYGVRHVSQKSENH